MNPPQTPAERTGCSPRYRVWGQGLSPGFWEPRSTTNTTWCVNCMNYYVAYSVILYGNTNNTIILVLNLIIAGIVHCLVTQYSIVYRFGGKPAPSDSTLYSSHKQMYFKLLSFSSLRYLVRGHITESHIEEEQRLPYFFCGHCYIFIPCSALILFFSSIYHLCFLHYPERKFSIYSFVVHPFRESYWCSSLPGYIVHGKGSHYILPHAIAIILLVTWVHLYIMKLVLRGLGRHQFPRPGGYDYMGGWPTQRHWHPNKWHATKNILRHY